MGHKLKVSQSKKPETMLMVWEVSVWVKKLVRGKNWFTSFLPETSGAFVYFRHVVRSFETILGLLLDTVHHLWKLLDPQLYKRP